jgi:thiopurine S-methyltransferase
MEKWENAQIGFHLSDVHPMLRQYWPALGVGSGSRVFAPLCGKSLDLLYLREQGCEVTGVELSPIAVEQFFAEHGLQPVRCEVDSMAVFEANGIRLVQGDFFKLRKEYFRDFDAVYDRAALIAMPPDMQGRYACQLMALTPVDAPILLITLEYDPREMDGPPFSTPPSQVETLFGQHYVIERLESAEVLADNPALRDRGLTALTEAAWRLAPV